ncbi:MAG TPA: hypothetical protein VMT46_14320 [Anaerolineaceae bacterium]|nr:hypothetical protein [Anaerolineaceae bacterium]
MDIELTSYAGWSNCIRVSNPLVDLVITTVVGPRVIRFGFVGDRNEFKEYSQMLGKTGGDEWRIYGGHRLWHAPEQMPRSYYPDNGDVEYLLLADGALLIQPVEHTTGIQKEIEIHLDPQKARVQVIHRLRNCGLWDVELAPWALSVMRPGGTAILPLPPRQRHDQNLLPVNSLSMWAYTDFSDPRWSLGNQYLLLRQDPQRVAPQKIGLMDCAGWIACANGGHLFVKKFQYQASASYPDFGSNVETFTNDEMLELETLGPIARLQPGQTVEHPETWLLFRDVTTPQNDADVTKALLPLI